MNTLESQATSQVNTPTDDHLVADLARLGVLFLRTRATQAAVRCCCWVVHARRSILTMLATTLPRMSFSRSSITS